MLGGLLLGVVGYAWLLGFIGPGNKGVCVCVCVCVRDALVV